MNKNKITTISKILHVLSAILLVISIFIPIWRIELDAPQYPEGLALLIYSNKLGGDVEIINGLNHYIGMQTLHAENFIEFTVLPYIIGFFALLMVFTAVIGRKWLLYVCFTAFALFGVLAMVDFYRWNYNYGHNLDPHAAIIVPGMAYQPPIIGYKQLLNFGAFSIPDAGGWLFIISGIILLFTVLIETNSLSKFREWRLKSASILVCIFVLVGCGQTDPVAIKLHKDNCDFCQMTIADGRFAAEMITKKGRVYKFDDISCMLGYARENTKHEYSQWFVNQYDSNNILIDVKQAFFIHSEEIHSPMGGNVAAFASKQNAEKYAMKWNAEILNWENINQFIE